MSDPVFEIYSLDLVRQITGIVMLRNGGDHDVARRWLDQLLTKTPEALTAVPAVRTLAREFGWDIDYPVLAGSEGRYYKPPYNCQIPNLSIIYEHLFGQKADGTFLETGAYDGESFSNTSFLADLGWRGIYLEPVREFFDLSRYRHRNNPNVTVLQGAAGSDFGQITLDLAMMSSTSSPELLSEIREMDYAKALIADERQSSWRFPLNFVLEQQKFPQTFDLLVLDVEGSEFDALLGLDLTYWQPSVIIIELLDRHPDFAKNPALYEVGVKCRKHLSAQYTEIYTDKSNTIYVRS